MVVFIKAGITCTTLSGKQKLSKNGDFFLLIMTICFLKWLIGFQP
jgi:hypothetical protein